MSRSKHTSGRGMLSLLAASVATVAIGGAIALAIRATGDPEFDSSFASVRPGISEAEVIRSLGDPDERSSDFRLSQRESFESTYEAASRSGATYWLLWRRGVDLTYAVGIGPSGTVVFKAVGGT